MQQQQTLQVRLDVRVQWFYKSCGGSLVAVCPVLRLSALGDDYSDIEHSIASILDDWFRARIVEGNLREHLANFGWHREEWYPPADPGAVTFRVPFELLQESISN